MSLVLEIGLFNIKHWETLGNNETSITLSESASETSVSYHAQIDNVEANALAFDVDFDDSTPITICVSIADSGNSAEEYELPEVTYYASGRHYLMLGANGYVKSITLSAEQSANATVCIGNASLNPQIPFCFQVKRFVLALVLLLIIGLIRPGSSLWNMRATERSRASRVISAGALVVALFFALIAYSGPTDDGDAAWYHTFAYNEYTQLARSFAQGNLYLEEEPPSWLQDMEGLDAGEERLLGENNVYDVSQREKFVELTSSWCKDDAAYINGHYYVYFGVVPVVMLYLPFYLASGMDLPDSFATMFAIVLFIVFSWLLLREICSRWFSRASAAMFLASYATLLCASGIVISVARPQLYNEPVVFALMFAVVGLWLLLRGYAKATGWRGCVLLFAGALCLSCIAGCRPQLLLMAAALLWVGYKTWRTTEKRERMARLLCLCIPVVIVGAALMWYNYARFGSPFDFGANYNLAGNDMTLRDFSIARSIEGIVYYLFSTPHVTTAFPFFEAFFPASSYMAVNMSEPLVMGIFIQCPVLFGIFYYLVAHRKSPYWLPVGWLALAGVVIAVFDANGAGILGRYAQDFGVFFGLAAAIVMLDLDARERTTQFVKSLVSCLVVVMILFTVTARLSLMAPSSTPTGPRESTAMVKQTQPLFEFWR